MKSLTQQLFILTLFVTLTQACPQAFDWVKLPAEERAAKAAIVVVGYVTKSYKHLADEQTTYSVDFKILRTLKGASLIESIPHNSSLPEDVHKISNFGSMLRCFADLNGEHVFMLFLHIVDDHLSAHYSDLFGAAEIWTMQMEDKVILQNLGELLMERFRGC